MEHKQLKIAASLAVALAAFFGGWAAYDRVHRAPKQTSSLPQATPEVVSNAPPETPPDTAQPASRLSDQYPVTRVDDPELAEFSYASGWPIQLPGEGSCTPVVADLLGDGKLEIVVTCRAAGDAAKGVPEGEPLVYAFRADGTVLPGWPVAVQEADPRKARSEEWRSSPSVFRRHGKDEVVLVGAHAGIVAISGDGKIRRLSADGIDWHSHLPLADLDGDGVLDIVTGRFIGNVEGGSVSAWPAARRLYNGYSPCVGDALGTGSLCVFQTFYATHGEYQQVSGFNAHGEVLPGWPQKADLPAWHGPSMGDVLGNGQMQIIAVGGDQLFAWNPDGTPLPKTFTDGAYSAVLKSGVSNSSAPVSLADLDGDGKADIVLFDQNSHSIRAWHGDGTPVFERVSSHAAESKITTADILEVKGTESGAVTENLARQWRVASHVDKSGQIELPHIGLVKAAGLTPQEFRSAVDRAYSQRLPSNRLVVEVDFVEPQFELRLAPSARPAATTVPNISSEAQPTLSPTDGLIASLPWGDGHGVSVVSLGDDPKRMDFFVGTHWVDRQPDGQTKVIPMVPHDPAINWVQPTVADVEGNGKADVVVCTQAGRVFVYQTGLAYHADRMQWPTAAGNFQHTGACASRGSFEGRGSQEKD